MKIAKYIEKGNNTMSKSILVISSSPRKGGNSDILCDEFIKGAIAAGNKAEKIFLRDKTIHYCTGCGVCNMTKNTECSLKDDMNEILDKMMISDVIVFATPIYFYSMSGQMKTFIDRMCSRYPHIINKEFYYILTAADNSHAAIQHALGEFRGLMSCLKNPLEKGCLFAGGVWQKGDILNTEYPKKAYELGHSV